MRVSDETPGKDREETVEPAAETPDAAPPEVLSGAIPEDAIEAAPPDDAAQSHALTDEPEVSPVETEDAVEPEPAPERPLVIEPTPPPTPRRPRPTRPVAPVKQASFLGKVVRRLVILVLIVGVLLPVGSTLLFKFVPPPVTILMVQRVFEGKGLDRRWMSLKRMSPALPNAVIAAEDARYCSHWGFDFQAMEKAMAHNQRRPGKIRGGSTISQQTAKNIFLWPQRSYVRKGLEAYFTVLIETLWGKKRIMEVYLNSVEWGPGVYGADSAARRYFGVGADKLTAAQASRLAAILPSPLKWKAATPGPYVRKRSKRIGAASGTVRREGLAACVR